MKHHHQVTVTNDSVSIDGKRCMVCALWLPRSRLRAFPR